MNELPCYQPSPQIDSNDICYEKKNEKARMSLLTLVPRPLPVLSILHAEIVGNLLEMSWDKPKSCVSS